MQYITQGNIVDNVVLGYPLIIGEHGTGKTSLLRLALNDMKKTGDARGIVYAGVPSKNESTSPVQLSEVIGKALGLNPNKCN